MSRLATLSSVAALALLLEAPAEAQVPKSDSRTYYEDDSLYGFRVKVPKNWEFVPPQPDEHTLIGKYDPPTNKMIDIEGGALCLSGGRGRWEPDRFEGAIAIVQKFCELWPRHLLKELDS